MCWVGPWCFSQCLRMGQELSMSPKLELVDFLYCQEGESCDHVGWCYHSLNLSLPMLTNCPEWALSVFVPHPRRCLDCKKDLWAPQSECRTSVMAHSKHSGNSMPLKPDTVIAQRPCHAPHPIAQSQNSHSHRVHGSHSCREQGIHSQPYEPLPSNGESHSIPKASHMPNRIWLMLCLGTLSPGTLIEWGDGSILQS